MGIHPFIIHRNLGGVIKILHGKRYEQISWWWNEWDITSIYMNKKVVFFFSSSKINKHYFIILLFFLGGPFWVEISSNGNFLGCGFCSICGNGFVSTYIIVNMVFYHHVNGINGVVSGYLVHFSCMELFLWLFWLSYALLLYSDTIKWLNAKILNLGLPRRLFNGWFGSLGLDFFFEVVIPCEPLPLNL